MANHICSCEQKSQLMHYEETFSGSYYECKSCGLKIALNVNQKEKFIDFSVVGQKFYKEIIDKNIVDQLTPSELYAYRYVLNNFERGTLIVELYCEIGRLLYCLKEVGYNVMGVDPLISHIDLLNQIGIKSIDLIQFNEEYINDVAAIICLESIVRLKNPHEIFQSLEKKYCNATFIVTAPSDQRSVLLPFNYCNFVRPPNHMTKWSKSSLGKLFNTTNISTKVLYINFNPIKIPNFFKFLLKLIYRIIGEGKYSYVVVKK